MITHLFIILNFPFKVINKKRFEARLIPEKVPKKYILCSRNDQGITEKITIYKPKNTYCHDLSHGTKPATSAKQIP